MSGENVIFIGFMGAGKTSVGRAYAQTAGIPLVDTDQMIDCLLYTSDAADE